MDAERNIVVRKLEDREHGITRELYELAFPEDGRTFTDYYYQEVASRNEIFAALDGNTVVSMVHLNFYELMIGKKERTIPYLVAVATHPAYRRRGLMRNVLKAALTDLEKRKTPFVFLMPASEKIYQSFDFSYISSQRRAELDVQAYLKEEKLECRRASLADLPDLEWFSGQYFKECQGTFAKRTENYYERLLKEQLAQNGDVALLSKDGQICGWFFTAEDDEIPAVREAVVSPGLESFLLPTIAGCFCYDRKVKLYSIPAELEGQEKPLMMGRIVDPAAYAELVKERIPEGFSFCLQDPLLLENQGAYVFQEGELKKRTAFCNLPVYQIRELMERFSLPEPVFLNEVV